MRINASAHLVGILLAFSTICLAIALVPLPRTSRLHCRNIDKFTLLFHVRMLPVLQMTS